MTIILIEFSAAGRPFSVTDDERNYYDVEYCKRDHSLYAHWSGGGQRVGLEGATSTWWAAPGIRPEIHVSDGNGGWKYVPAPLDNRVERVNEYALGLWEWASEQDCAFCSTCADMLPTDSVCEHIWWDTDIAEWSTPDSRLEHFERSVNGMQKMMGMIE